jgi:hypothetical protein
VIMTFVLECVKTLQVLSSLVLCITIVTVTIDACYWLRSGVHVMCLVPVSEIASVQQKAQYVLWYAKFGQL